MSGYSFSTRGRSAKSVNNPMKPGKRVKAEFFKAEVTDEGHLDIWFKNDTGSIKHREFCIDPSHPKFDPENADESMDRITHICAAIIDQEATDAINGEGVPFATYAGQLAALLNAEAVGEQVELHVIVKDGQYVSLPRYMNFISSERNFCSWNTNPKHHKYEFVEKKPDAEADQKRAIDSDNAGEEDEEF